MRPTARTLLCCAWLALLCLASCDRYTLVPCDQCARYGAVCNPTTRTCQHAGDGGVAIDGGVPDLPPMCTAATVASDCSDPAFPVCAGGSCAACGSQADDAACAAHASTTPRCQLVGPGAGRCVACRAATQAADCAVATPICGDDGACRRCRAHGECPALGQWSDGSAIAGLCADDGHCAAASQVALVDNGAATVAACSAARTQRDGSSAATAYCDIQEAVAATRPFVTVKASPQAYGPLNIARSVVIVGPGPMTPADPTRVTVQITGTVTPGISVGGSAAVLLDGLDVVNTSAADGLFCSNGASGTSLTVRRTSVRESKKFGLNSNNCVLNLDANFFGPHNSGGGVHVGGATYVITNSLIFNNFGDGVVGVVLDFGANGTFAFNTVAGNGTPSPGSPGGIICSVPFPIMNSIVSANGYTAVGGTQFGGTTGNCQLTNVVTGPDSATGAITMAPAFVSASDFHLKTSDAASELANRACCIDKLPAPATPNADHDVDFTARPKGPASDIGAHEAL